MTNIDECLKIKMSDLKRLKFLSPGHICKGTICWGEKNNISIIVDMVNLSLTLDYKYNGEPIMYEVSIEGRVSNLGFGKVYYFKWQHNGKIHYFRNLYLYDKYFVPRVFIPNVMYNKQIESKFFRDSLPGENPRRKRGKWTYNGKFTPYGKRMLRFYEREERCASLLMSHVLKHR